MSRRAFTNSLSKIPEVLLALALGAPDLAEEAKKASEKAYGEVSGKSGETSNVFNS